MYYIIIIKVNQHCTWGDFRMVRIGTLHACGCNLSLPSRKYHRHFTFLIFHAKTPAKLLNFCGTPQLSVYWHRFSFTYKPNTWKMRIGTLDSMSLASSPGLLCPCEIIICYLTRVQLKRWEGLVCLNMWSRLVLCKVCNGKGTVIIILCGQDAKYYNTLPT